MLKFSLTETKDILLSSKAVEGLLDLKDELALRLYIYLAQHKKAFDIETAAARLGCSADKILAAADILCACGLISRDDGKLLERPDTIPEYTQKDVSDMLDKDNAFSAVLDFTQEKLGKILSTVDTQTLLGIYNWMGLPPEVICLLVTYCTEREIKKYGEGRRPTMKNIENEARIWLNMGILTTEQAEEYLRTQEQKGTKIAELTRLLHISGRALSPTEEQYLKLWIDEGYSEERIMEAYDVTVVQTGKLSWKYMDRVLKNKDEEDKEKKEESKSTGKMSKEQLEAFERAAALNKKWEGNK